MIEVTIAAVTQGQPVVTTPDSINETLVSAIMAPIAAKLMGVLESATGVYPAQMIITINWADGTEPAGDPEPTKDHGSYSNPSIPKHLS